MSTESLLEFWCQQLAGAGKDWAERFRHWQCAPGDQAWESVERATAQARAWASDTGFAARPAPQQASIIVCLSQSEQLTDQELAVGLSFSLEDSELTRHLQERHEVIRQYRRFPARNRSLGRGSTPAEAYFLTTTGQRYR